MALNYHHLHSFWRIASEGSLSRAAARMHVSHSTLSVQLRALEDALGIELFERRGKRLVLTALGDEIHGMASQIFRLGRELEDAARGRGVGARNALRVGALATIPKSITCRLLEPVLKRRTFAIDLQHAPFDRLLEGLAAGRLHLVIADQAAPQGSSLRLHSHQLGETGVLLFGAPRIVERLAGRFPASLEGAPMILPRAGSALRRAIDAWLAARDLDVEVVAEIDDAGDLRAFGLRGHGLFPVRTALASEVSDLGTMRRIGVLEGVAERYVAITRERTVRHPAISDLIDRARDRLDYDA
jgi:LysR family transcriptional activator of nhaA